MRNLVKLFLCLAVVAAALSVPAPPAGAADRNEFVMLYFPQAGFQSEFSNDWGDARSGGRHHQGTDIFNDKLTPVLAIADGFVERIKEGDRSGWYVMLRHADGWESYYMHLNDDEPGTDNGRGGLQFAVAEGIESGTFVKAGEVIGYVGDSGNAEGSRAHTHFELHHNGRAVNPYHYLAAAWHRKMRRLELAGLVR